MQVYLLERTEGDVPLANDWLSAWETIFLNGLRFAKRRADWRLGRWTAKHTIASYLNLPDNSHDLAKIEIRPAPSGAPEAFVANAPAPVTISLSHRNGTALCAIAPSGVDLGCDLEIIEPRSEAFVADYFTPEEHALIVRASPTENLRIVALLWSAKESALKALREGLRLDTRSVSVRFSDRSCDLSSWNSLDVRCPDGSLFYGWWRDTNSILRTVVANPPPDSPISMNVPVCFPDNPSFDFHQRSENTKEAVSTVHL